MGGDLIGAVQDSNGRVASPLAGFGVRFNGVPASVVYDNNFQASVVFPCHGEADDNYEGGIRLAAEPRRGRLNVLAACPGLFSSTRPAKKVLRLLWISSMPFFREKNP